MPRAQVHATGPLRTSTLPSGIVHALSLCLTTLLLRADVCRLHISRQPRPHKTDACKLTRIGAAVLCYGTSTISADVAIVWKNNGRDFLTPDVIESCIVPAAAPGSRTYVAVV